MTALFRPDPKGAPDVDPKTRRRLVAANDLAALHRRLWGSVFARTSPWVAVKPEQHASDYERLAFRGTDTRTADERAQDDHDRYRAIRTLLGDGLAWQTARACIIEGRSIPDLAHGDDRRAARLLAELETALDVIADAGSVQAEMARQRAEREMRTAGVERRERAA